MRKQAILFDRIINKASLFKKTSENLRKSDSLENNPILTDKTLNMRRISISSQNDDLELTIMNLTIFEEERALINLRSTLAKNILPTLNTIEPADVIFNFIL